MHLRAHLQILLKIVLLHSAGIWRVCGVVVWCVFRGREALLLAWPAVGQAVTVLDVAVLVAVVLWGEAVVAGLHPGGRVIAGGRGGGERVLWRIAVVIHGAAELQWFWRGAGRLAGKENVEDYYEDLFLAGVCVTDIKVTLGHRLTWDACEWSFLFSMWLG